VGEPECAEPFKSQRGNICSRELGPLAMPEPAEDMIVQNLLEALGQLRADLDRVELWAAALRCFQAPVPNYQPAEKHILPSSPRRQSPQAPL
jgi:hypothetical protein